jgi:PAS domain S-box-containing protein
MAFQPSREPSVTPIGSGNTGEHLFRLLIENVLDYAIFMLSPEGIVSSWNAGAERIKGYRAHDIIGSHFSKFYTPEAIAEDWPAEELRRSLKAGRFEDEGWRVRKDGSKFWANVIITPMRGPQGELLGFSKVTRDLTERRQHEEQLRQSERHFRLLIEGVRDHAIILLDEQGKVMSWNAGAERVKGYRVDEVIGHHYSMFYPPEEIAQGKPQRELEIAGATGVAEDTGWRLKRDGTRFWAEATLTALRNNNESLRGFALMTRDLTESRRVQALENEGKRTNEFIAMLGHELRNPLAPIRNAVGILDRKATSPEIIWCKDVISRQVDHLARLVDDLLDVSRISSGKIQLEKELVDLNSFVSAAVESVRAASAEYGHTLEVKLPEQPVQIIGDPTRLTQVIVNLLNNAMVYTPNGGLIQVELEQRGGFAYVRVRDNGIGMSGDLLEKAFDLFVQGARSLDRPEGGLGIGLTLVKRIVDLHGGAISASSAGEGRGSDFVVSLPAIENNVAPVRRLKSPPKSMTPRKILVVDDNIDAAHSLAALLEMCGHALSVAHSGADALHLVTVETPDLVLLDIGLPAMNGYEVARRMRELPGMSPCRLVAITGYGQESDKQSAAAAGFDAHLVKPVDFALLVEILEGLDGA